MRTLVVTRRPHGLRYRQTVAAPPRGATVHEDDVLLLDDVTRQPVAFQQAHLYAEGFDWVRFNAALDAVGNWDRSPTRRRTTSTELPAAGTGRLSGISGPTRTFGWLAPQPLRHRFGAQRAALDAEHPALLDQLAALGTVAYDETCMHLGSTAWTHRRAVLAAIAPVWWLSEAPWTSGIINRSNPLPYHKDAGNLAGCLSAMVAVRRGVDGGALHLADYDVWFAVPDQSLIAFSGATLQHGVSPMRAYGGGRRYTIVWYVKERLTASAPSLDAEVARAQLRATTHDRIP